MSEFERVAIPKRMRFDVFKRDGFACQYCGATPPGVLLECDHIEPVALGGLTDPGNLITACQACNRGKGAEPLSDIPQSLSELGAETAEREAQIAGYEKIMRDRRLRLDADAQEILDIFCAQFRREGISRKDFLSIRHFVEIIGLDEVVNAAMIACAKKPFSYGPGFRYFCGVCWNKHKDKSGIPR